MNANNQKLILTAKVIGVFACLFVFLIGISGLSKAIGSLTTPDKNDLKIDDMAILKEFEIGEGANKEIKTKEWVTITSVLENKTYGYEYKTDKGKKTHIGVTTFDNISKTANSAFVSASKDPFICLFIGVFATVLFQSSSTTTSLIVGMAGGGLLLLPSAVPMVMGANIGTTVTNTIVSLGHLRRGEEFKRAFSASTVHDFFNILAVLIFFPLEMMFGIIEKSAEFFGTLFFGTITTEPFKSPIKAAVDNGVDILKSLLYYISDSSWLLLIVSVIITLVMLISIVKLLKSMVLAKLESFFDKYIFKTALRGMIFGFFLTILVQSSSITTSVVVPLAGAGVLTLRQIFPFTLGANIGTTVTSIMAALVLNPTAMIVAFSHLLFNIFGILTIYPIKILRNIPLKFAEKISELALKNKFIPLLYLAIVFILIPLTIILIGG